MWHGRTSKNACGMNHGWEKKRLGDVCSILNGFAFKSREYVSSGIRIIRIANVQDGYISDELPQFYPDESISMFEKYLLHENDLLISLTGNVGRVALLPSAMLPAALNQRVACLRTHNVNKKYIYHFLQNVVFKQDCIDASTGIAQLNLSTEWLKEYKILLPPISCQKKIVDELDRINELIEVKRSQLADLDLLAQSLFYEMFGDPINNPKGWRTTLFGNLIRLKSGDALSAKFFCDGSYPVYGGNGIAGYHNRYNVSGENIIIGRVGALCGNVRFINGDIFVTDNAFVVKVQQNIKLRFLERMLTLLELRKYANAAAQPVISNTSLKAITIPIPPIELQNEFAAKIEAIEKQKEQIESSITDLQTLLASRMDYWFND